MQKLKNDVAESDIILTFNIYNIKLGTNPTAKLVAFARKEAKIAFGHFIGRKTVYANASMTNTIGSNKAAPVSQCSCGKKWCLVTK